LRLSGFSLAVDEYVGCPPLTIQNPNRIESCMIRGPALDTGAAECGQPSVLRTRDGAPAMPQSAGVMEYAYCVVRTEMMLAR
jgi:hypothetical protein